jgi:pimeloyl-ACP methyl ester carboxylesterase
MGFIEGQTLQEKLASGPLDIDEALDYAIQMVRGLDEAHRKGVLHRDVKPGNVMITSQGQVKLMDFGLARLVDQTQITKTGMVVGTPAYMSPEQASGQPVDNRTDVWALGAVLYQILTGKLPFRGDQPAALIHAIQTQDPVSPRKIRSEIPEDLERICLKALSKKPASRYDSMADVLEELTTYRDRSHITITGEMAVREVGRRLRRPRVLVPIVAVLVLIAGAVAWSLHQRSRVQWARDVALPEIQRLIEENELYAAFVLAREAEPLIADHAALEAAWPEISNLVDLRTSPRDARVAVKDYLGDADAWIQLGTTPLEDVRVPRGVLVWRIEKPGYETVEVAGIERPVGVVGSDGDVRLVPEDADPTEMTRIPSVVLTGYSEEIGLNEYLIDRYEVTNRQFKEFIEAGGYRDRKYWTQPIMIEGSEIDWQNAISLFVDSSGRPGPAGWELGEYREGRDDYPVTGVSWYEAAAYAEWAGKSLPTMTHWFVAAHGPDSNYPRLLFNSIAQRSNMHSVERGPTAVGTYQGVSAGGAYDMGGNVKEWCWNEIGPDRITFGGAWSDENYWLVNRDPQNPLTRIETIGFRCVRYLSDSDPSEITARPIPVPPPPDFSKVDIASDEAFTVYQRLYEYDRVDPQPVIEARNDSNPHHIRERVRFKAACAPDDMLAYVYLPRAGSPPFQTVVDFPGSVVSFESSVDDVTDAISPKIEIFTRSGRAFVMPVYRGTLERGGGSLDSRQSLSSERDKTILWTREYRSTLDYLATRDDIDSDRLAFRGLSMGAGMAPFILAVEDRIKAAILIGAGIAIDPAEKKYPEVSKFNFLPRIDTPVLMIAGSDDRITPVEESQQPLFELIGTSPEHKRLAVLSGGHIPPVEGEFIREQLDWLDRYLGPVE